MIDQFRGAFQYFLRLALRALRLSRFHLPSSISHLPTTQGSAPCKHPYYVSSVFSLLSSLFFLTLFLSSPARADVSEHLSKLHPSISVQGLYDDNIYVTQDNKIGDFITTVSPGLKYKTEGTALKFDLGFDLGMNFYATNPDLNYISYNGHLDTSYSLTPRWTVKLYDTIIRSRNNLQSYTLPTATGPQTVTSSSTGQGLYLQNVFQPALEYKFGRENVAAVSYLNNVYRTEGDSSSGGYTQNAVNPRLTYWFDIRQGMALDYTYTNAKITDQPDWVGNNLGGRYLHRYNPHTTVFGEYRYTNFDYEFPGRDYSVQSPTVGVEHAFSPSLNGKAHFGWFWQVVDVGPSFNGPVIKLSVTQRVQRTSYTLTFDSGWHEQSFSANTLGNQGFSKYYLATAVVTHQLRERLSVGLTGSLTRDEYQLPDHIDYTYSVAANLAHRPLKWLTAALEAGNYGRNSDLPANSYRDNRVMLKLTAEY